jgi:short-subunit dehydrogenase
MNEINEKKTKEMIKTALITGASSGIGRELTKLFARDGYNVVLVARREERLRELADDLKNSYGTESTIISKDLSQSNAPKDLYDILKQRNINVDVLVNNAGFDVYGEFHETDYNQELNMIKVNLITPTYLTKLFLPDMISRGSGKILNLGSVGSFVAAPLNAIYCATKAYILSMSLGVGEEIKNTGVSITCLCPGVTKTEFHKVADMEDIKEMKGKVMSAQKVAKIGYKGLMKGKSIVIPGWKNKIEVFMTRLVSRKQVSHIAKSHMETI